VVISLRSGIVGSVKARVEGLMARACIISVKSVMVVVILFLILGVRVTHDEIAMWITAIVFSILIISVFIAGVLGWNPTW